MEDTDNMYEMKLLQAPSLRNLVDKVNEKGLLKEDIVQIIRGNECFYLLYY